MAELNTDCLYWMQLDARVTPTIHYSGDFGDTSQLVALSDFQRQIDRDRHCFGWTNDVTSALMQRYARTNANLRKTRFRLGR